MKKTSNLVDLSKFIASIMVVYMHTSPLYGYSKVVNYYIGNYFGRIAVLFFFIASGFFLFRKVFLKTTDLKSVIGSYLLRITRIYFIWMIIYTPIRCVEYKISISEALKWLIKNILINETHLWYLEAVILGIIITYILYICFGKNIDRVTGVAVMFGLIGALLLSYDDVVLSMPIVNGIAKQYYSVFGAIPNGFFVGFPFITFGAFLAKYIDRIDKEKTLKVFAFSAVLLFIEVTIIGYCDFAGATQETYIMAPIVVSSLFVLLYRTEMKNSDKYLMLRKMSTLIYLSHQMFRIVYKVCLENLFIDYSINGVFRFIFTILLSLGFSYAVVRVSGEHPCLKIVY